MNNSSEFLKNSSIDHKNGKEDIDIILLLKRIFYNLSQKRKIHLFLLTISIILSGLCELFSLAAIVPFLSILINPEVLWKNKIFQEIGVNFLNLKSSEDIVIPVAIIFLVSIFLSSLVKISNLWFNLKISSLIGIDFSTKAFQKVIYESYSIHINRNSSLIIQAITKSTAWLVFLIELTLKLASSLVIVVTLLIGILFINTKIALLTITLFAGFYGIFALKVKRKLKINSFLISRASEYQIKLVQEILGSIKDILLDGNQTMHVKDYKLIDSKIRKTVAVNKFIASAPRFFLEAIGLIFISLLALYFSLNNSINDAIPLIGAIALAAQKLLPTLQQIFASWAGIKANASGAKQIIDILEKNNFEKRFVYSDYYCKKINFNKLEIQNLNFRYSDKTPIVLKNINLHIHKGEKIGFVGSTGSGKSTLIDILMGLLSPTKGNILVNGENINSSIEDLINWRFSISHVPQNVYLADKTIAENIALGSSKDKIDYLRLNEATKNAMLSEFIKKSPKAFQTFVGEQGVKLSGGQRQRIGIARALYKKNEFFVFDEATSALDNKTEEEVIGKINKLKGATIIMIAHRLSTLKICDRIIKIDKGLITYDGPPKMIY